MFTETTHARNDQEKTILAVLDRGTVLSVSYVPGETTAEQIAPVLLDLSALALRLDKPLTARLMPIPNKKAGDPTGFDFAFFANSSVMALESEGIEGPLGGRGSFTLRSR